MARPGEVHALLPEHLMSHPLLTYETVVYYNDYETDARWAACRDLILRSGMHAVTFYSIREHELRHLPLSVIGPRIEQMAICAAELRREGIETAAALLPSLGWGQVLEEGPFQKITGADGTRSGTGSCPLDPALRDHLVQHATLIGRAGFTAMSLEDDFQHDNHRPVRGGCFCPLHVAAFSAFDVRTWDRPALAAALQAEAQLAARWEAWKLGVLVDLAERLQQATGGLPLCLLAGPDVARNPRPIFGRCKVHYYRPAQGAYDDDERFGPVRGAWVGASGHHRTSRPLGLRAAAELTAWPRNASAKSWTNMMLQAAVSAFEGLDILLFWAGHGPRDPGFEAAVTRRRSWFERLRRCAEEYPHRRGIGDAGSNLAGAALALARMGLPVTYDLEHADTIIGREIVDCATLADGPQPGITRSEGTFYAAERFTDDPLNGEDADWPSTCLTLLREFPKLTVEGDVRVLAEVLDTDSQPVAPSVMLQTSPRRLILNHDRIMWQRLISVYKARQMRRAIEHVMGKPLPAVVTGATDTFVIVRESADARERVVLVVNLSLDNASDWRLELDRTPTQMFIADDEGEWQPGSPSRVLAAHSAMLVRHVF